MLELLEAIKWDLWRANKAAQKLSNGIDDAKFDQLRTLIRKASTLNGELRARYEAWGEQGG